MLRCLNSVFVLAAIASQVRADDALGPEQAALLKTFRDEFVSIEPGQGKFPARIERGESDANRDRAAQKFIQPGNFLIAKYEVPQNLWEAVMGSNPSKWTGLRNSVEMLSLDDAGEFCRKATAMMRTAKLIEPGDVVRLPTEAEWEYCSRAGTDTRYSFGDDPAELGKYGWFTGNAKGNDPPVGAKAPNPWGLYDMHGYLWEWCGDDWDGAAAAGAEGDAGKHGIIRGGSWKDEAELLESRSRRRVDRTLRDDAVGLRCVLQSGAAK